MIFGRKSIDRIMRYVMSGNHRHSKFAARLLVFMKNHDEACAEVVEVCLDSLVSYSSFVGVLSLISLHRRSQMHYLKQILNT